MVAQTQHQLRLAFVQEKTLCGAVFFPHDIFVIKWRSGTNTPDTSYSFHVTREGVVHTVRQALDIYKATLSCEDYIYPDSLWRDEECQKRLVEACVVNVKSLGDVGRYVGQEFAAGKDTVFLGNNLSTLERDGPPALLKAARFHFNDLVPHRQEDTGSETSLFIEVQNLNGPNDTYRFEDTLVHGVKPVYVLLALHVPMFRTVKNLNEVCTPS